MVDQDARYSKLRGLGIATVFGGIALPLSIGFVQSAVYRPLGLRAHQRVAPLFGALNVFVGGVVASKVFQSTLHAQTTWRGIGEAANTKVSLQETMVLAREKAKSLTLPDMRGKVAALQTTVEDTLTLARHDLGGLMVSQALKKSVQEAVIFGSVSILAFKAGGGRFRSLLPSSLWHPGAFAVESLPATAAYATKGQRKVIHDLGNKYGCHSCGNRGYGVDFHADHIPPNALAGGARQRFFPQCQPCSSLQGASLSRRTAHSVTHGFAWRGEYAWLPVGPFIVALLPRILGGSGWAEQWELSAADQDLLAILDAFDVFSVDISDGLTHTLLSISVVQKNASECAENATEACARTTVQDRLQQTSQAVVGSCTKKHITDRTASTEANSSTTASTVGVAKFTASTKGHDPSTGALPDQTAVNKDSVSVKPVPNTLECSAVGSTTTVQAALASVATAADDDVRKRSLSGTINNLGRHGNGSLGSRALDDLMEDDRSMYEVEKRCRRSENSSAR
eukprot:m.73111 g.73111  ORF g.73111 m.73111 type:complete len:510 (+) comp12358_c2_seq1:199-1728(+)